MIILVIGKLTRTEQRLINRIKEESKNNEISKVSKIIVVHNLAQFHKIKEVEKHINTYLLLSATFNLEEMKAVGKGNRVFYVEKMIKMKILLFFIILWLKKEQKQEIIIII